MLHSQGVASSPEGAPYVSAPSRARIIQEPLLHTPARYAATRHGDCPSALFIQLNCTLQVAFVIYKAHINGAWCDLVDLKLTAWAKASPARRGRSVSAFQFRGRRGMGAFEGGLGSRLEEGGKEGRERDKGSRGIFK